MIKASMQSFLPHRIDAIVLADGAFPTHPDLVALLLTHHKVICCDGAAERLIQMGVMPATVIGDLDSISNQTKALIGNSQLIHQSDQETNDLTKAVHYCAENELNNVVIMGATGKREDHTLGNISLLSLYHSLLKEVVIVSDYGIFAAINTTTLFASYLHQQVSIFSLIPTCLISVQGLLYPIEHRPLEFWWQGTLNESCGTSFTVQLHTKGLCIVFREW
jgi:thiamine pyrophosphokinase